MKNYVVAYGKDCDGFNSGHIDRWDSEETALNRAEHSNGFSDGLLYTAVDAKEAEQYCQDYRKNFKNVCTFNLEGDLLLFENPDA